MSDAPQTPPPAAAERAYDLEGGGVALESPPGFWGLWWRHMTAAAGGLLAIALGTGDHFIIDPASWSGVDLSLIYAGLGTLGVTAATGRPD